MSVQYSALLKTVKLKCLDDCFWIFLIFAQNIYCGYSLPTIYVFSKNMKIVKKIHLKIVIFTTVKKCSILHVHGRVFVMTSSSLPSLSGHTGRFQSKRRVRL